MKRDREMDNLYGRLEAMRLAYSGNVARQRKQDRVFHPEAERADAALGPDHADLATRPTSRPLVGGVSAIPHFQGARTELISFLAAPFPYDGNIGQSGEPFFNIAEDGRRGHRTPFNRVYWEKETYNDPSVLLHIPRGFNITKPGVIVLFFHGHGATLERDVMRRQEAPQQISASGINAVLVAPQLARDARDSSAGKFWERGGFKRFLSEAEAKLAEIHGDPSARAAFRQMPVILVSYSGGYLPAAAALEAGGMSSRVQGVVLLDALYGHVDVFRNWITSQNSGFFVSAFTDATRARNKSFEQLLGELNVPVSSRLSPRLGRDSVVFIATPDGTDHRDFVTDAWVHHPIEDILKRIDLGESPFVSAAASPQSPLKATLVTGTRH